MSKSGRPPLKYILLDLPAEHEIEQDLATECEVLYATLANQGLAAVTKRVRIQSAERLKHLGVTTGGSEFVHISGHATKDGLWLLGGIAGWTKVATSLAACVSPVKAGRKRILNLSCCHSEKAAKVCKRTLKEYFSGAYYFAEESIPYAKSTAAWVMFFFKQPTMANHREIADSVNRFMGKEVLRYMPFHEEFLPVDMESIEELERIANRIPLTRPR